MDLYKIFEVAAPSITTGGFIVVGAYFGYFKKKFATYGDIDAKLEKLDKLEKIERRLESAKFNVQIERMEEILSIEKKKSKNNRSIEFEYHRRKEDLDKIIDFGLKISESRILINDFCGKTFDQIIRLNDKCLKEPDGYNIRNLIDYYPPHTSKEIESLISEISLRYNVYFKDYDVDLEFSSKYLDWHINSLQLMRFNGRFIKSVETAFRGNDSSEKIKADIMEAISKRNHEISNFVERLDDSERELLTSFINIAREIKNKHFA